MLLGLLYWLIRRNRRPTPPGGDDDGADIAGAIRFQREIIAQLLTDLERRQTQLNEYLSQIERLAVQEREMRVQQTELRSASLSCRQDRQRLVQLHRHLAQLYASERSRLSSVEQERYQEQRREVSELHAALRGWQRKLELGLKELTRQQLTVQQQLTTHVALREDLARSDELRARLLMLQGRLDSGDLTHLDAAYYSVVQSILECKQQMEQIKQHRFVEISAEELARIQTQRNRLARMVRAYSLALVQVRKRSRRLLILLAQLERRRNSFALEDAAPESPVTEGPDKQPAPPETPPPTPEGATRFPAAADDREPIIEWEVLQDQSAANARFSLVIRVRNPHVDLVFRNLAVELTVRRGSAGAAAEEIGALSPATRLEFGDMQFVQHWETRDVALQGAGLDQANLLVTIIATWTV